MSDLAGRDLHVERAISVQHRDEQPRSRLLDSQLKVAVAALVGTYRLLDRFVRALERVVDLGQLGVRVRGVRGDAGDRQGDERDDRDRRHEPGAQRHLRLTVGFAQHVADQAHRLNERRADGVELACAGS